MSRASFAGHFSRAFQQGPIDFVQKVRLRIAARPDRDRERAIIVQQRLAVQIRQLSVQILLGRRRALFTKRLDACEQSVDQR